MKTTSLGVAALGLAHEHIISQVRLLLKAGARLTGCYDRDPLAVRRFLTTFPETYVYPSCEAALDDYTVDVVATAAIPCERALIGEGALLAGKDVFSDKPGFTSLEQVARIQAACAATGRKYVLYYPFRNNPVAIDAIRRVRAGEIGNLVEFIGLGPHRAKAAERPEWFFDPARAGTILADLAVHAIDFQMHLAGGDFFEIVYSRMGCRKFRHPAGFFDYGEIHSVMNGGVSAHTRVDWLAPDKGIGDSRMMILGTEGYLDLRLGADISGRPGSGHLYAVTREGVEVRDSKSLPPAEWGAALARDFLDGTSECLLQEEVFATARAVLTAEARAWEHLGQETLAV